jgi:hypothetical protein
MFYSENDISKLLNCEICKQRMFDPRCLPCGNTVCYDCISNENEEVEKKINCKLCSQIHLKESILANNLIDRLIELNPNEINRTKEEKDLKEILKKIKDITNKFVSELNEPSCLIKEHYMNLRNEVQQAKETSIQVINDDFDKILIEIDDSEKETLKTINADNLSVTKLEIESETNKILNKWKECLSRFDLDNLEISKGLSEAKNFLKKQNEQNIELKNKLFNNKILTFSFNKVSGLKPFGNLFFKEKFEIDTESLESVEFGNFFIYDSTKRIYRNKSILTDEYNIYYLEDEYESKQNKTYLKALIKCDYKIKKSRVFDRYYNQNDWIEKNASNLFLFCITKSRTSIYVFDKNLDLKSSKALTHHTLSSTVNETKIFCLINDLIYIYNTNFYPLSVVGQNKDEELAYYMKNILKIRANNQFLFALNHSNVIFIYEIETGLIYSSFSINTSEFLIYEDQFLLTYNGDSFCFYKFDGQKNEFNIKLDYRISDLKLIGYDQKHLSFLNNETNQIFATKIPDGLKEFLLK